MRLWQVGKIRTSSITQNFDVCLEIGIKNNFKNMKKPGVINKTKKTRIFILLPWAQPHGEKHETKPQVLWKW